MKVNRVATIAVIGIAAIAVAQQVRIELRANLAGLGKGKVDWKVRDGRNQRQAELEAEGERLPANTAFTITIGSNSFPVTTNSFGTYRLSRRYTTATRPNISAGDSVVVTNVYGTTVQTGVFLTR